MSRRLTIRADDEVAEISVLDGGFNLVARDVGRLDAELPVAIYVLRVRVGPAVTERLVALDRDRVETFDREILPSPVPLPDDPSSTECHVRVAEAVGARPRDDLGRGGTVMIFVRDPPKKDVAAFDFAAESVAAPNVAAGLSLRRWDDPADVRIDIASRAEVRNGEGACAGWSASVDPGPWVLTLRHPGGEAERSIWVGPGNHVQLFMWGREYVRADGKSDRAADLGRGAVVISPTPGFRPDETRTRIADLARYALTQGRRVLSDGMLGRILADKFDDATLGLIGAHLLVRDRPDDRVSIERVLANLRRVMGADNPDLQALALRSRIDAAAVGAVRHPPMLRAGWDSVVEATAEAPNLIVEGSPAATMASRVLPSLPWLTWQSESAEADRTQVLRGILDEYLASRARLNAARTISARADHPPQVPSRRGRIRIGSRGLDPENAKPGKSRSTAEPSTKSEIAHALPSDERDELARALGVPSGVLSDMLSKVSN